MDELGRLYLDRLWKVAAGVSAFCVVQMLTFLYALQNSGTLVVHVRESWWGVLLATLVSGLVYSTIVLYCFRAEKTILTTWKAPAEIVTVSTLTIVGHLAVIWLTTGGGLMVLIWDKVKGL